MFENFQFKKFEPTEDLITYANAMLNQIMETAPSDATCSAIITKVGNHFECSIKIASSVGYFKAESREADPRFALDRLEEKITANIKSWKKSRRRKFDNDDWFSPNSFGGELLYA